MTRGTIQGEKEEIYYTKKINLNLEKYSKILGINPSKSVAVHLKGHQLSKINNKKVKPKADIIICSGENLKILLESNDYYLEEKFIEKHSLVPIFNSGISIKLKDSKNYTYTKMTHNTFIKIFSDKILGCGSSIYCKNENELFKNQNILYAWGVEKEQFQDYFTSKINHEIKMDKKHCLEMVKTYSNQKIKDRILKDKNIFDFIFKGIGSFEEPFTSHFIIENNEIKKIEKNDFKFFVTTGSGRSKGIYTIVIKPSN